MLRTALIVQLLSTNHYKTRLLRESVYTVCPAAYQNFEKKRQNWSYGKPESRRLEPPQQFIPFQRITTKPGYCVNPSITSARLPIKILNKKRRDWHHGRPESGRSELPRRLSPFQIQVTAWIRFHRLPGCLSEFWSNKDKIDATVDQNLDA